MSTEDEGGALPESTRRLIAGRIGDSVRALEDARLHAELVDHLNDEFERRVEAGLERYENEPAYHHRVTAIANALARDELLTSLVLDHPTRSHLAKRLALRAVVANAIIGEKQLADYRYRGEGSPRLSS